MGQMCLRFVVLTLGTCMAILGSGWVGNTVSAVVSQNETDEVRVAVTVVDQMGRPVSELSQAAFSVFDGKKPQPITFFSNQDSPASVAIVFDTSESTSDGRGRIGPNSLRAIQPLTDFVRQSDSRNEYFIVGFNENASVLLNGVSDTEKAVAALGNIRTTPFKGNSSFFDVCYSALKELNARRHSKKILIVVSDGEDSYSRAETDDVKRVLLEDNVVVYAFYSGTFPIKTGPDGKNPQGPKNLEKLSELSGGQVFYPKAEAEFHKGAAQMTAELHAQYVLGFTPSKSVTRGKCYEFKINLVKTTNELLRLRSRDGYCLRKAP